MFILLTVLHAFLEVLTRRICLTIKGFFSWWSFPLLRGDIYEEKFDASCSKGSNIVIIIAIYNYYTFGYIWSTFVIKNSYCTSTCIHLSLHTHCRYLFNMSCFSVIPSEPAKMFIQNGKSIHVFLYIFTFWWSVTVRCWVWEFFCLFFSR